ncbi:hypothetical protein BJX76DRAFT_333430 [Aspergillus varians]
MHLPKVYLQLVTRNGEEHIIEQIVLKPLTRPRKFQVPKVEGVRDFLTSDLKVIETLLEQRLFKVSFAGRYYLCKICTEREFTHEGVILLGLFRLRVRQMLPGLLGSKGLLVWQRKSVGSLLIGLTTTKT